jgi:RNA polymerase sigma factor (sigma-70 family)
VGGERCESHFPHLTPRIPHLTSHISRGRGGEMKPEDVLIKRAAVGDKAAYEKLVDQYKKYVFAIVLNLTRDSFHAENIAQEVFLQVYISLPGYRFEGFRTWIGRIATRKAIDWKRKQLRIAEKERLAVVEENLTDRGGCDSPEDALIRKEEAQRIRKLCGGLPDGYRTVVEKYYFSGKSYRQIADEEGIALKTVETRLYRARQKLKEQWRGEG